MKNGKRNVLFIGLLSFFGGISQDIFLPLLPIYLGTVLGYSKEFIGLTEGLVISSTSIFRIAAGFVTDRMKLRRPVVFAGYFLSLIGRPLLAIVTSAPGVMFLRFLDGAGKGIKDTPKDALIADSTKLESRGRGFGIALALDTLGSVAGPLLLAALLFLMQDNQDKFRNIFLIAALPLVITLLLIIFQVKEMSGAFAEKETPAQTADKLPRSFFIFLGISVLFGIGNSSSTFLILRAEDVGVSLISIPLVYALYNLVYASASIPLGSLSDRIGREKVVLVGWAAFALAYLGFGLAAQPWHIWILFALYGIYFATTEGVAKALVADLVAASHRGRAYGLYNTVIGLVSLPAGLLAGYLWENAGSRTPFFLGALTAFTASILLGIFLRFRNRFG